MRPPLADLLDLQPHPEGGWYRQTWVSPETVTLPDGRHRATATLIHFLLPAGASSAWHRVASDEVWLAHTGSVVLELGGDSMVPQLKGGGPKLTVGVDLAAGEVCQAVVPAHVWQRTVPTGSDALVSCLVSPGFDFTDFQLADDSGADPVEDAGTDADTDVGVDLGVDVGAGVGGDGHADPDDVQRAPAGPEEGPVDPSEPTNPA